MGIKGQTRRGVVFSFCSALMMLVMISCGGGGGSSGGKRKPPSNTVTAVALATPTSGNRQTTFNLSGANSSSSAQLPLTYSWTETAGGAVSLSPSASAAAVSFQPARNYVGDYLFDLTVSDGKVTASDSVRITVTNIAPSALAGATPLSGTRRTLFTLDGRLSTDSDNDPLTYSWEPIIGPSVVLQPSPEADTVSFIPDPAYAGDYVFALTVDDGLLVSGDTVRVSVSNHAPVGAAVSGFFGYPNQKVTLDASASADPDGDPLSFAWLQLSGPAVSLDLSVPSKPTFTPSGVGQYVFQVTVSDGLLQSQAQIAAHIISPEFQLAPHTGQNHILFIMVNFSDETPAFGATTFQNLLFGDTALTMRDYYKTVSYGNLDLVGDFAGWYTLSHPKSYYVNSDRGVEPMSYPHNLWAMAEEAIDLAHAHGVDFSKYDNDGDGWVDSLIILHSGIDYQRSNDPNNMATLQIVLSMGRGTERYYNGVKIDYLTVCPELRRPDPVSGAPRIMDISTYIREYAYLLGMKRSTSAYIRGLANPPSNPTGYEIGLGLYDLMGYGVYGGDGSRSWQPDQPVAFHKTLMDWINPVVINADTTITLPAVETHPFAVKVPTGPDPREYFLLENRQAIGYDEKILSKGLFITHVDQTTYWQNSDGAPSSDPAVCDYPGGFYQWRHPMLMLEQADGQFQLEAGVNIGDAVDSWKPGKVFSSSSVPSSLKYNCYPSGIKIDQISEADTVITAHISLNQFQADFANPKFLVTDYNFSPTTPLSGDTDPYADPGETLDFKVKLFNIGTSVSGLTVQWSTTSQYLVPILTNSSYPDLLPGDSAYNTQTFRLQVKQTNASEVPAVLQLNITANGGLYSVSKNVSITIGVPSVLLIDDDGGAKAEQKLMMEMYMLGYQWTQWEVTEKGLPSLSEMLKHRLAIWITGPVVNDPLDSAKLTLLKSYLDAGGKLLLTSQYLLVNPNQETSDFANNYLHIDSWNDDDYAVQYVWGSPDSPISSNLLWTKLVFINYYTIFPRTVGMQLKSDAITVFKNDRQHSAGVQFAKPGGYGVLFTSFGIEHFNYEEGDMLRRMLNGMGYLPGQPVITQVSPTSIVARSYGVALALSGVNLGANTSVSFPEGGINVLSQSYNPSAHTINLSIQAMFTVHPGFQKIMVQNPGVDPAVYDRYLYVLGSAYPNHPPVAIATANPNPGTPKTLFTLDGSQSSDPDHEPITYLWTQLSGPTMALMPSDTAKVVSFQPNNCYNGDYVFNLEVYDGSTTSGDTVRISALNHAPVAVVPEIISGNMNDLITLDGTGSYDPDLDPFSFYWAQTGGPLVSFDHSVLKTAFVPLTPANYLFTLTLNDGCTSSTAQIEAIINDPNNHLPVPVVAWSYTVSDSRDLIPVCLDATPTGDHDPVDGDLIHFQWQWVSKPAGSAATLDNSQVPTPCFFDDLPGYYTLNLRVTDYTGIWSAPVQVKVYSKTSDLDGDLIPDDWELANGLDPTDPTDANADPDHDGLTNLNEYFNGTDPQKAEPWLISIKNYSNAWQGGFFGDADGDFSYGSADQAALSALIASGSTAGYAQVYPPTGATHDFNGDGAFTAADNNILTKLMAGDSSSFTGAPSAIVLVDPAGGTTTVQVGKTGRVMVQVTDADGTPRGGSAVIFDVVEGTTIAQLLGGDGQSPAKRLYHEVSEVNRDIGGLSSTLWDGSPCLSPDGLEMFYTSYGSTAGVEDIFYASRGSINDSFSTPSKVDVLSAASCDDYPGSMTGDGKTLFMYRICYTGAAQDQAKGGIYYAERTTSPGIASFTAPVEVSELNAAAYWELSPWITQDGLTVYYTSNRPGGSGLKDIWRASRNLITDAFGAPQNVSELNSPSGDGYATLSADQLHVLFLSNRAGGKGGWDLYESSRANIGDAFAAPWPLKYVNRSSDEQTPFLSADGLTLYFAYPDSPSWDTDIYTISRPRVDMPFFINLVTGRFDLTGRMNYVSADPNSQGKAFMNVNPTGPGTIKIYATINGDPIRLLPSAGLSQIITINAVP